MMKNDSGSPATFTILLATVAELDDIGVTPSDFTLAVADGKTYVLRPSQIMENTDGNVIVECNVAGKVLVLNLG